jgi:hypothetical protein
VEISYQICRGKYILYSKHFISLWGAVVVVMVWQLDLQLPVKSVPFIIKVVSSKPVHCEVYSIQHYVIKFVSCDRSMVFSGCSGFLH